MMRRSKRSTIRTDVYEIRPRADKDGVDLVSDALPYSPMWYRGPKAITDAIDHAQLFSRSHDAVEHIYDDAGNVIETHQHPAASRDGRAYRHCHSVFKFVFGLAVCGDDP